MFILQLDDFSLVGSSIFDHQLKRLLVVANAFLDEFDSAADAYQDAIDRIAALMQKLDQPHHVKALNGFVEYDTPEIKANTTQAEYEAKQIAEAWAEVDR